MMTTTAVRGIMRPTVTGPPSPTPTRASENTPDGDITPCAARARSHAPSPFDSALRNQMLKQMEHLMLEKGKLAQENATLSRELQRMQELLTYTFEGHSYEEEEDKAEEEEEIV